MLDDLSQYYCLVGCRISCLIIIKPNIVYIVQIHSQFMSQPRKPILIILIEV